VNCFLHARSAGSGFGTAGARETTRGGLDLRDWGCRGLVELRCSGWMLLVLGCCELILLALHVLVLLRLPDCRLGEIINAASSFVLAVCKYVGIQQLVLGSHDGRVMFLVPMSKILNVFILLIQLSLVAIEIPLLVL
jgi:hypothetical protein